MRQSVAILLCIAAALTTSLSPARAASNHPVRDASTDWNSRDTAVYVVSTINLLRTRSGISLRDIFTKDLSVIRFEVYDDISDNELYFIRLKRGDGISVGALAYRMGWTMPRAVTQSIQRLGVKPASRFQIQEYNVDPLQLIGAFKSTLP